MSALNVFWVKLVVPKQRPHTNKHFYCLSVLTPMINPMVYTVHGFFRLSVQVFERRVQTRGVKLVLRALKGNECYDYADRIVIKLPCNQL